MVAVGNRDKNEDEGGDGDWVRDGGGDGDEIGTLNVVPGGSGRERRHSSFASTAESTRAMTDG